MELRLGRGSPLHFPGPLESHRPLNKEWDLPGRRRRGGKMLRSSCHTWAVCFKSSVKEGAFLRRARIGCGQGCSPMGLVSSSGPGSQARASPTSSLAWPPLDKDSHWEGRMQHLGVPKTIFTSGINCKALKSPRPPSF